MPQAFHFAVGAAALGRRFVLTTMAPGTALRQICGFNSRKRVEELFPRGAVSHLLEAGVRVFTLRCRREDVSVWARERAPSLMLELSRDEAFCAVPGDSPWPQPYPVPEKAGAAPTPFGGENFFAEDFGGIPWLSTPSAAPERWVVLGRLGRASYGLFLHREDGGYAMRPAAAGSPGEALGLAEATGHAGMEGLELRAALLSPRSLLGWGRFPGGGWPLITREAGSLLPVPGLPDDVWSGASRAQA